MTRVVAVRRSDYTIAYGAAEIDDLRYEVEGQPFIEGFRQYLNVRVQSLPDGGRSVAHEGDIYDGTELIANSLWTVTGPELMNDPDREERVFLDHLWVDPPYRRQEFGSFLFDAYKAAAVWHGGTAAGRIGGGAGAQAFFVAEGIPEANTTVEGSRAKFSLSADRLRDLDDNIVVSTDEP